MFLIPLATAAVLLVRPAAAQAPDTVHLRRLPGPIAFDGMPGEPAWDSIAPLPVTVFLPVYRADPTERTEIRVAYDDHYLYLGGRLYDSDPEGVRTNTLYRDQYSGDDVLGIVLDTYSDHQTASWFAINPAGMRSDRALSNDGEFTQSDPMNINWNTFWDAKTVRTPEGWFAELLSPTSNLSLDLTLNTDFAQVEADDQQINLTRFSLFFPEKRQFFQERSAIFDFDLGDLDRLSTAAASDWWKAGRSGFWAGLAWSAGSAGRTSASSTCRPRPRARCRPKTWPSCARSSRCSTPTRPSG